MPTYNVDTLLAEAEANGLYTQLLENRYWRECRELQWWCWLRSKANQDFAVKGEGNTAGEALNAALNKALSYNPLPEIKITGFTQDLDSILPALKPRSQVSPALARRFRQ